MQIKVVLGIHNDGSEPYNISGIMGSLNSPTDFSMYIQNFTQQVGTAPAMLAITADPRSQAVLRAPPTALPGTSTFMGM
jgi:hypothetical protein